MTPVEAGVATPAAPPRRTPLYLTPPRAVVFALDHLRAAGARTVLDAGTGTGAWAEHARREGFAVVASDIDPTACQVGDLPVERVDLSEPWPWPDGRFDAVTSFEVIEHLENPFRALREAARVLRPGGRLVCSIPNGAQLERRVRFLLAGSAHRPDAPGPRPASGPNADGLRHRRAWGAGPLLDAIEDAGLRVLDVRSAGRAGRKWWLIAPALLLKAAALCWPRRHRPRYRLALVNRLDLLIGGSSIIVAAERP